MSSKKNGFISVPTELILDTEIPYKAKYLYIILKKHSFDDDLIIKYEKLMSLLKWKDKKSFKKYLLILKVNGYISYEFKKIIELIPLEIKIEFKKPFIKLDRDIINKALDLSNGENIYNHEKGLLLLYYLEYNFNEGWGYSCPSFEEINNILKMDTKRIKEIIWLYHINYICEYTKGYMIGNLKIRNRYVVNNTIYDSFNDKYKKRYKNHKAKPT